MPTRTPLKPLARKRPRSVRTGVGKSGAYHVLFVKPGKGFVMSPRVAEQAIRRKQIVRIDLDSANLTAALRPRLASTAPSTAEEADRQIERLVKAHASSLDALAKL
jgi:hypothetical protein